MSEIEGRYEARAESRITEAAEPVPLETEAPQQTGEFYHQVEGGDRPAREHELGHAALAGYEDLRDEPASDHAQDIWDRRNEVEGRIDSRETEESSDADDEVLDIWDRRNEASGSINLRHFGR